MGACCAAAAAEAREAEHQELLAQEKAPRRENRAGFFREQEQGNIKPGKDPGPLCASPTHLAELLHAAQAVHASFLVAAGLPCMFARRTAEPYCRPLWPAQATGCAPSAMRRTLRAARSASGVRRPGERRLPGLLYLPTVYCNATLHANSQGSAFQQSIATLRCMQTAKRSTDVKLCILGICRPEDAVMPGGPARGRSFERGEGGYGNRDGGFAGKNRRQSQEAMVGACRTPSHEHACPHSCNASR